MKNDKKDLKEEVLQDNHESLDQNERLPERTAGRVF